VAVLLAQDVASPMQLTERTRAVDFMKRRSSVDAIDDPRRAPPALRQARP